MSYLNLMRNELKPKDVNDALENLSTINADDITYDNTTSHLTADDVQSAIDEINATLENIVTPDADEIDYDNTTSQLTADDVQGAIDEINTKVNSITFDTIASITANENETFAEVIDRLRDTYFDDLTQFRQIKMDIDGTSNMIFTCVRWSGVNVSFWVSSKPTSDTSMTTILIGMSSTIVSVRKFVTSASGVAGTSMSTDTATGTFSIQGLKFS